MLLLQKGAENSISSARPKKNGSDKINHFDGESIIALIARKYADSWVSIVRQYDCMNHSLV